MEDLFSSINAKTKLDNAPLAVRMRPRYLREFAGQKQAVGEGSWLKKAIEHDVLSSVIFYGPAGTGKTTLSKIIAHTTESVFVEVSAVSGTVKDLRHEISLAESRLLTEGRKTILFVDEIHRFTKSQQDALLHAVEDRIVILIGATTENPFFEVNQALLSRSRVIELKPLNDDDIKDVILRALEAHQGLNSQFVLEDDALEALVRMSGGDARSALTMLELASQMATPLEGEDTQAPFTITLDDVEEASPSPHLAYDKNGDMHYDIISAFIKSMRGGDPDASVYWLARMLSAGEDPKFIARRIYVLASEDIGNADPQALLVAEAAFKATEVIGMPECRINLAQACIYMALAPKSNASYVAINQAMSEVKSSGNLAVPQPLRDRHRPGADKYEPYLYPHEYPSGWVKQQYMPDRLAGRRFFDPSERGWERWRLESVSQDRTQSQ